MNAVHPPVAVARRDDFAAWLVVTAYGMLLTRSLAIVGLIAAAWRVLGIEPRLLALAAGYLALHAAGAFWMVRRPGWPSTVICPVLLVADAVIAGLLLGGGLAWPGPGIGMAMIAIGLAYAAAGRNSALLSASVVVAVTGAMAWSGIVWHVRPLPPAFSPTLSVERSFPAATGQSSEPSAPTHASHVETSVGDAPVGATAFTPRLSVERSFNGVVAGLRAPPESSLRLLASLLAAALALIAGNLVNLARVRRLRTMVTAAIAVDQRLASLSCGAPQQ